MRNFITLLAILFTGMVIAQRSDVNRTFSGVTFEVRTAGSENTLGISTMGTFNVVDDAVLDPLYEYTTTQVSMNVLINSSINPNYNGPVRFISFENLTWHRPSRIDWSTVLNKTALPQTRSDALHVITDNLGSNRDFILTLNIGSFAIHVGDDGAYTVFEIGLFPAGGGVRYRDSNNFCVQITPDSNGNFEVLKPGLYTILESGVYNRYTFGRTPEEFNFEYNVWQCVSGT